MMKSWIWTSRTTDEEIQPRQNKRAIIHMMAVNCGNGGVERKKEVKFSTLGHIMARIREARKPARV